MDKIIILMRLATDLHEASGPGPDALTKFRAWVYTAAGQKIIRDVNDLLTAFDIPIQIGIVSKE